MLCNIGKKNKEFHQTEEYLMRQTSDFELKISRERNDLEISRLNGCINMYSKNIENWLGLVS